MSSNEESSIDTPPPAPSQYTTLFEEYVVRSIQATRDAIPADALFLEVEVRERAMHLLSFGLEVDAAWAHVRDLILCIAPKMEQAGHREDWLEYLTEGLACSQQQNDNLSTAEFQWHIGHLQRLQSQFVLARQNLNASAATFAVVGNPRGQARAWNELGHMAWHQQQHAEAQQLAEAALACLEATDLERAASLSVLGLVAVSWRHWSEGEYYFSKALQIRTAYGDQQRMAWTMQHMGYVHRSKGDLVAAIPYYAEATQILTAINDQRNCAITQMSLGILYYLSQQYTEALTIFAQAEAAFQNAHDILHLAKIFTNRGLVYLAMGDWQQAKDVFAVSTALYEKLQDLYAHINALDGLGLAYIGLGLYDEAVQSFEVALDRLPLIQGHPSYPNFVKELSVHLQEAQTKRERSNDHFG